MTLSNRMIFAGIVLLLIASAAILTTGILGSMRPSGNPPTVEVMKSTCDRPPGFILIIADLSGFNNSIGHGAPAHPWPIVHVQRGDVVRFLVCNRDPTQPHGFAIQFYLDSGVVLASGDAYQIVFTATEVGTFEFFCNILCTIHIFMRGQLIVS